MRVKSFGAQLLYCLRAVEWQLLILGAAAEVAGHTPGLKYGFDLSIEIYARIRTRTCSPAGLPVWGPALRISDVEFDEATFVDAPAKESDEWGVVSGESSVHSVALRAGCLCPPQSLSMKIKANTKTPVLIAGMLRL